jgi:hypothetical protein
MFLKSTLILFYYVFEDFNSSSKNKYSLEIWDVYILCKITTLVY